METGHDSLFTIRESPNTPDGSFYEGNLKKAKMIPGMAKNGNKYLGTTRLESSNDFDHRFWHKKIDPVKTDPKFGKHYKGIGNNMAQDKVSLNDMRDLV